MAESRDTTILVHIESSFAAMLKETCPETMSMSSYVRRLLIEKLIALGKVDDATIKKIFFAN